MKNLIPYIIVLFLGAVVGWLSRGGGSHDSGVVVGRDTLTLRDTVREFHPVEVMKERRDTMLVVVHDTLRIHDTLYMSLQTEKRFYKTEEYYAEVSGYKPRLDYIEVYPKTTYVTERAHVKPNKWRFDLSVGVDIGKCINPYVSPNLGAEIGFGRWSLTGGLGCELSVQNDASMIPYMYYEIGLRYSLLK